MTASQDELQRRDELVALLASPGWSHLAAWAEDGIKTQMGRILQRNLDHRLRDLACEAVVSSQAFLAWPEREIEHINTKDEKPDRGANR